MLAVVVPHSKLQCMGAFFGAASVQFVPWTRPHRSSCASCGGNNRTTPTNGGLISNQAF